MTWDEVDLGERFGPSRPSRMKAGKEHRRRSAGGGSPSLRKMRAKAPQSGTDAFVFPGARHDGTRFQNMALIMTLRRMRRGDLTAHGFRSTFSDWTTERTNFPSEVREMALAHAVGNKVEEAERRGDLQEAPRFDGRVGGLLRGRGRRQRH